MEVNLDIFKRFRETDRIAKDEIILMEDMMDSGFLFLVAILDYGKVLEDMWLITLVSPLDLIKPMENISP